MRLPTAKKSIFDNRKLISIAALAVGFLFIAGSYIFSSQSEHGVTPEVETVPSVNSKQIAEKNAGKWSGAALSEAANTPAPSPTMAATGSQSDLLSDLDHVLAAGRDLHVVRAALKEALDGADPAAVDYVRDLLMDADAAVAVRVEAALALGAHGGEAGAEYLRQAYDEIDNDLLIGPVLDGLAQSPFDAEEGLLANLIRDPEVDGETRVMALDALGEFTPAARDFLLDVAANDPAPYMRSSAVEAASLVSEDEGAALPLAQLVLKEDDATVRTALYQAVAADNYDFENFDKANALADRVAQETEVRARLSGIRMLAAAINTGNLDLVTTFNNIHVPWVVQTANDGVGRYELGLALDALVLSRSDEAKAALNELSNSQRIEVAEAASNTLARLTR